MTNNHSSSSELHFKWGNGLVIIPKGSSVHNCLLLPKNRKLLEIPEEYFNGPSLVIPEEILTRAQNFLEKPNLTNYVKQIPGLRLFVLRK